METEEEEALMVKVFESFEGDEPFHSSNVKVLLDIDGEGCGDCETESMPI